MNVPRKPLWELTAADVMSREVAVLPHNMPLRDAAQLLVRIGGTGAPVVDAAGHCVGVLSASDYLRRAAANIQHPPPAQRPVTCSFQATHRMEDGREETACTLAPGVCPIQMRQQGADGEELVICREPHSVPVDWQIVDLEKLPTDDASRYMTPDPITTGPQTPVPTLARMMIERHVHRLVVVDVGGKPVGIVSSIDLLAVLADGDGKVTATSGGP